MVHCPTKPSCLITLNSSLCFLSLLKSLNSVWSPSLCCSWKLLPRKRQEQSCGSPCLFPFSWGSQSCAIHVQHLKTFISYILSSFRIFFNCGRANWILLLHYGRCGNALLCFEKTSLAAGEWIGWGVRIQADRPVRSVFQGPGNRWWWLWTILEI